MRQGFLMGLDAGSGGGRCLLVDIDTCVVTIAYRNWTHLAITEAEGWWLDLDTDTIWHQLGEVSREAMQRAGATPEQVLGIAATSMRHAMVVIDEKGKQLLATPNRDARAAGEAITLSAERGIEFYKRTGHWPAPIFAAARLLWMAHETPDLLARAHLLLSLSDWVSFRLCGVAVSEPTQAGETMLFDLETCDWAWDLIDSLSLPRDLFPPLSAPGKRLGTLTDMAAKNLGLRAGIPVAVGGADTQAGLLGAGAVGTGSLAAVAGTTTPIQLVLDHPLVDQKSRLWTGHYIVPDLWVLESNAGGTGDALEWLAGLLYPDVRQPVGMLIAEAIVSSPGAAGILSTLGAEIFNAKQMSLPVSNLTFSHMMNADGLARRRHLARATLEGMAYGLQANVEQILEVAGIEQPPLLLAGGMSRSSLWAQTLSDISGAPVRVATPEASALGVAICAGVGSGIYGDLAEGAISLVRIVRQHDPIPGNRQIYQSLYSDWKTLRAARAEADNIAAELALQAIMRTSASRESPGRDIGFRPRMLVTAEMDKIALDALRTLGEVEYSSYREEMRMLTADDLVEALQGYDIFITEIDVVDVDALQKLPDLRLIFSCRGKPVNIDVNACTALGLPVLNTPGRNADAVADLTISLMIMLARKIFQAARFLREPGGEAGDMGRMGQAHFELQGGELWRKTVGLVGLGAVGREVARRLGPFNLRLLVHDPYISPEEALLSGAELVSLETLLAESDFVSLHAAVTDGTRGLIGAQQLARMKPGAYLINTARAALVDEGALVEALKSGHLGGAALDVFAVEPPGSDHPLLTFTNVIATPHIAGNTVEVSAHQGATVVEDLTRLLRGEQPLHVVNVGTLEGFSWTEARRALSAEALKQLRESTAPAVSDLEIEVEVAKDESAPLPATRALPTKGKGVMSGLRKIIGSKTEEVPAASPMEEVKAHMERILRCFVDKVVSDEAMRTFSTGKQVIMFFMLTDIDLAFYLSFVDGKVSGELGDPPGSPDVTLKMKADLLDGMFTGRTNATRAAMTGKLSFHGDTMKAMSLQRIQKDLTRLYKEAREEIGDPGDLTRITAEPEPTAVKAAPVPGKSIPSAAPVLVRKVGDIRDEILGILNELYNVGLITATGGNISARIPGYEGELWITPSQIFKGDLRPEMMVRIDLDGNHIEPASFSASSERFMHCAIMRNRPDVEAVIHTHAPKVTILGLSGLPFLPISPEAAFIGDVPRVPFIMPGTKDLAEAVAEALENGTAVLMQNHGLVVAGSSLRRATDMTEIIEQTAENILACYALGKEPPVLPDDVVTKLREIGRMMV